MAEATAAYKVIGTRPVRPDGADTGNRPGHLRGGHAVGRDVAR